mmetsp:Transcript_34562/g.72394  ORF Transcript_34562/g.72394 Transcript_34562/m.72394 type:complete len:218 (-) Transcript_34562:148-801(-)
MRRVSPLLALAILGLWEASSTSRDDLDERKNDGRPSAEGAGGDRRLGLWWHRKITRFSQTKAPPVSNNASRGGLCERFSVRSMGRLTARASSLGAPKSATDAVVVATISRIRLLDRLSSTRGRAFSDDHNSNPTSKRSKRFPDKSRMVRCSSDAKDHGGFPSCCCGGGGSFNPQFRNLRDCTDRYRRIRSSRKVSSSWSSLSEKSTTVRRSSVYVLP